MDELIEAYNEFRDKCLQDIVYLELLQGKYPNEYPRLFGKIEGIKTAMENMRVIMVLMQPEPADVGQVAAGNDNG